jgi:hypothetical protein
MYPGMMHPPPGGKRPREDDEYAYPPHPDMYRGMPPPFFDPRAHPPGFAYPGMSPPSRDRKDKGSRRDDKDRREDKVRREKDRDHEDKDRRDKDRTRNESRTSPAIHPGTDIQEADGAHTVATAANEEAAIGTGTLV